MQFEPHGRILTRKEVMNITGLTQWQTQSLLFRYGVQIGAQKCISVRKLQSLIDDGTVEKHAQRHGGRPPKKEGEHA